MPSIKNLCQDTHEEFEAEANYFASLTLFQHDRFITEANKFNLGIDSSIQLSKLFGASIHATLRRYVEYSKNRCALLVLEKNSESHTKVHLLLRDKFQSTKFSKSFGELKIPHELNYSWDFVQDFYSKRRLVKGKTIFFLTQSGQEEFKYDFFNNTFNAFIFIYPNGEKKTVRTKIIISNQ